jgi:hypothetical protein
MRPQVQTLAPFSSVGRHSSMVNGITGRNM